MIIDAHIHVVPPKLPGAAPLPILMRETGEVAAALKAELAAAEVSHTLAMGALKSSDDDPLGIAGIERLAAQVPGLFAVGAIDPTRTEPERLQRVAEQLEAGRVKALKAYLGYQHCGPDHPGYHPYYALAERFRIPVFCHTGDPHSAQAKLKFTQPLLIDEVAVDFPGVSFVMAHLGCPWTDDAAEVIYKNVNVWADLSGLIVGDAGRFSSEEHLELLNDQRAAVRRAMRNAERPNRFLYASDWPMAPMRPYRDFLAAAVPADYHDLVFVENARLLFRLND